MTETFVAFYFHNRTAKMFVNLLFKARTTVIRFVLKPRFFNESLVELFEMLKLTAFLAYVPKCSIGFEQLLKEAGLEEIRKLMLPDYQHQLLELMASELMAVGVAQLLLLDLKD